MTINNILSLDVGEKRIGVARAGVVALLAQPQTTLLNDALVFNNIARLTEELQVSEVIVGLPRNINDEDTQQTRYIRRFADSLKSEVNSIIIHFQDEANTSQKAKAELQERNKPYEKADIDALAATYILQDFIDTRKGSVQ
ncbi:MAG: Holliday junction resolvase RuvX [Candidatus Saccharibacteria bacterium]